MAFAAAAVLLAAIGIYGVISVLGCEADAGDRHPHGAGRLGRPHPRGRGDDTIRGPRLRARSLGIAAAPSRFRRLLASLLFGVSPGDPWTIRQRRALLLLVAFAAG